MFKQPRAKKSLLPPPSKKRKVAHSIEEISFDRDARAEYLTGFHKRKVQRQKQAQEIAAEQARQEKIELRKQLRDERQQAVEDHVKQVHDILREAEQAGQDDDDDDEGSVDESSSAEWAGFEDAPVLEPIDHQQEYIDEELYTTVTVESVNVDRDGLHKPQVDTKKENSILETKDSIQAGDSSGKDTKEWPKKKAKKKFRYETKFERQLSDRKIKAKKAKFSR